jgi:hypothetical protein
MNLLIGKYYKVTIAIIFVACIVNNFLSDGYDIIWALGQSTYLTIFVTLGYMLPKR